MLLLFLLISAMPLVRHPLWEHFMSDLTAIKYLGLGCLACALFHCLWQRKLPALTASPQAVGMVALCSWAVITGFVWGAPIAWQQSPALSYLSFLLLLVVVLGLVDTWPRLQQVLWATIAAVAIASLYVVREWQEYHLIYAHFRPGWVTGDPNYFTASALVGLPLALVFCGRGRPLWQRGLALGCALLSLAAMGLAASRGGLLGLAAMGGWLAWRKRRLSIFVLLAALALPPLLLWSRSPLNRLMHPSASDIKSTDTRLALWQAGLHMIESHPLTGIGLGQFKAEVEDYAVGHKDLDHIAHNSYLALAAEMGLPALVAYLLILGGSLHTLGRLRARVLADAAVLPAWAADAALGMEAALIGFSVSAFFLSAQYTKLLWLLLAVTAALEAMLIEAPAPV
ncbi:MAG: O-antigen ligase family protein, partial [Terriglobales bacterium]